MGSKNNGITKVKLAVLGKIWLAEIEDRLPSQIKSKYLPQLLQDGYIEEMQVTFGTRFAVLVKGYQLTHLGRITYCAACK